MNATEQRNHKTVTAALDDRLGIVETLLEAVDARVTNVAQAVTASINNERTHRLTLADEQRAYVDGWIKTEMSERKDTDTCLSDAIRAFRDRGFWSRLNWLLRGY